MKRDEHQARTKHNRGEHKHGRCQAARSVSSAPHTMLRAQGHPAVCNAWAVLGLSMPSCSVLSAVKMYLLWDQFWNKNPEQKPSPSLVITFWMSWFRQKCCFKAFLRIPPSLSVLCPTVVFPAVGSGMPQAGGGADKLPKLAHLHRVLSRVLRKDVQPSQHDTSIRPANVPYGGSAWPDRRAALCPPHSCPSRAPLLTKQPSPQHRTPVLRPHCTLQAMLSFPSCSGSACQRRAGHWEVAGRWACPGTRSPQQRKPPC